MEGSDFNFEQFSVETDYAARGERELAYAQDWASGIVRAASPDGSPYVGEFKGTVYGTETPYYDTVAVRDGAVEVMRQVVDEGKPDATTVVRVEQGTVFVKNGEQWLPVTPGSDHDSFGVLVRASQLLCDVAARFSS